MPRTEVVTLRELSIGDKFYAVSDHRRQTKFKVMGDPEFNLRAGSATRKCMNLRTKEVQDKLCRAVIVKFISDVETDQ